MRRQNRMEALLQDNSLVVRVARLPHGADLPLPSAATALAAGLDLMAAVAHDAPVRIAPLQRALIPTGFCLALPAGFEAQVRPRSGLALKHGLTVLNAPGTIDPDYRGEVGALLINLGDATFSVTRGMRIAQLVIAPVVSVVLQPVAVLDDTPRGDSGFGSTGTTI